MKRLLLLFFSALLCTAVSAHDFEVDGIYYNITSSSDLTVAVTYQGSKYDSYSNEYSGSVVIPEKVTYDSKEYSVTSIGNYAFEGCSGMTSVTIPNSVTSIGDGAFRDCSGLSSLSIGNSVTSIGNQSFSGCSGITSVTIPNSVISIGYRAFSYCSGITSVTIPNSVTSIGSRAFKDCSSLTSIDIPNSVTSIGEYTFENCSGLTSVTIPNSVTSIGNYAFKNCSGLTSVTIPNSVTNIGEHTFSYCSGLTSVTIPNSVTSIGNSAFESCSGLTSVTIPDSVTSIGDYAFMGCSGLTSIYIPESVTRISQEAFASCSNITRIDCMAATPPLVYNKTFSSSIYSKAIIYVPLESIDLYKSADYWKEFTTIRHSGYVEVKSISFDKATVEIEEGDTMNLAVTISPEDATDKTISWKSSDETIATVNDGVVTAIKPGNATITATSLCTPAVTATCKIVVTKKYVSVTGIALDKTKAEMAEGETLKLTATISPDDATDKTITWTSSNESVATVKSGTVTAVKEGKAIITAKAGEMTASCEITVIHTDQCAAPVITYADGKLQFACETAGAECKYTLTAKDIQTAFITASNNSVDLTACYDITAYAVAEGYKNSEQVTATLYWINGSDVSTNINQTEMRGVMATCSGGIITVSGLTDGETVMFYDANGALLYTGTAQNGTISYAPSASGVIIVKIGTTSIKVVK